MQAKRQNPNFALLSLWSLAKMVIEMVARGVVVSTVWIWVSDKIWTMGVTKKPHSSDTDKTVQLFRNLKPPWGQQFAKCHKHVHFLKGTRLWNFWVNPELKKKDQIKHWTAKISECPGHWVSKTVRILLYFFPGNEFLAKGLWAHSNLQWQQQTQFSPLLLRTMLCLVTITKYCIFLTQEETRTSSHIFCWLKL